MKNWIPALTLGLLCVPSARAQIDGSMMSFGSFNPKAFLESPRPWAVYGFNGGRYSKVGFPCDAMGNTCVREKNYGVFDLRSSVRRTSINVGSHLNLGDVERVEGGTESRIVLKAPNNRIWARIDGTRASARMGFDAASSMTMQRTGSGDYGTPISLGHVESKSAGYSRVNPHSFYVHDGEATNLKMTVVEKQMAFGQFRNFIRGMPFTDMLREGTYWCQSDEWRLTAGSLTSLFQNDEFDMSQCRGRALLSSRTEHLLTNTHGRLQGLTSFAQNYYLNRTDSIVTLHERNLQYRVNSRKEWFCLFDCDGSTYEITLGESRRPIIHISSDRWNWLSETKFKIKVVRVDWTGTGLTPFNRGLTQADLAQNPNNYRDVVAVIVTEVINQHQQSSDLLNGQWAQKTFLMFPPTINNDNIPAAFKANETTRQLYAMRLLDGILAMMPDQTQASPELADAEDKLDELMLFKAIQADAQRDENQRQGLARLITADRLFDIASKFDATSAIIPVTDPNASSWSRGKIEWTLEQLGVTGAQR